MNNTLIKLLNINKYYNVHNEKYHVLKNISLSIEEGSFVIIMGKSGSGKTTLLNLLGLLDKFDSGDYIYKGSLVKLMDEKKLSKFRSKNFGFIFQHFFLIETMSIANNVELPLTYQGEVNTKKRMNKSLECLAKVGLEDKINSNPKQLSGGQQQRVSIARAIVNDPDIIIADEPTGALDTDTSNNIMNILQNLNKQGKTIIMVTHDRDLKKYATHYIELKDGSIIKEELSNELYVTS